MPLDINTHLFLSNRTNGSFVRKFSFCSTFGYKLRDGINLCFGGKYYATTVQVS